MMDNKPIQHAVRQILAEIGEDSERDGIRETWQSRVPRLWTELTEGYDAEKKPAMRTFPAMQEDLVTKTDIPFHSLCEHHLLPFTGTTNIAYVPDGDIVGLSKLIRYTRWVAKKLQTQERLTQEIADGLMDELGARGVMVFTEAEHLCETMRGIETPDTTTTVSAARGVFADPPENKNPREEFLALLHG